MARLDFNCKMANTAEVVFFTNPRTSYDLLIVEGLLPGAFIPRDMTKYIYAVPEHLKELDELGGK